jgi:hypothetical protein
MHSEAPRFGSAQKDEPARFSWTLKAPEAVLRDNSVPWLLLRAKSNVGHGGKQPESQCHLIPFATYGY